MTEIEIPPGQMALDLHVHTFYSPDCLTSFAELAAAVQAVGLTGIVVLDHNRVEGALRFREIAPFPVIIGEEVKTREGEIAGLFLEQEVPKGMSAEETVAAIQEQGGLVYLPHPHDSMRNGTLSREALDRIIERVDILEVLNARVLSSKDNESARKLADFHGLPHGAGSDAHTPGEVGRAYIVLPQCDLGDAQSFLEAAREARARGCVSNPLVHLSSTTAKFRKRLGLIPRDRTAN